MKPLFLRRPEDKSDASYLPLGSAQTFTDTVGNKSISGQVARLQFGLPGLTWKMTVLVTEISLSVVICSVQCSSHIISRQAELLKFSIPANDRTPKSSSTTRPHASRQELNVIFISLTVVVYTHAQ